MTPPRVRTTGLAEGFSAPATKDFAMLYVLVVDDEALIRWSLAEILTDAGHAVVQAPDAATARRNVEESPHPFDVVLLDFLLPDSRDVTLLADIRERSPTSAVIL